MNRTATRIGIFGLVTLLVLAAAAVALVSWHHSGNMDGALLLFDHDYSDSVLGWMIAIPIVFLVMLAVGATLTVAALVAALAVALAAILTVLAVGLALLPIALFLAVPALAIYGIFRLIQRDRAVRPA